MFLLKNKLSVIITLTMAGFLSLNEVAAQSYRHSYLGGDSPLQYALSSRKGCRECENLIDECKRLIDNGEKPDKDCLDYVVSHPMLQPFDLQGSDQERLELRKQSLKERGELAKLFVNSGVEPDKECLIEAMGAIADVNSFSDGDPVGLGYEVYEFLIHNGVKPDTECLRAAIGHSQGCEVYELLMKNGASPDAECFCLTFYSGGMLFDSEEQVRIIHLFIKHGFKPDTRCLQEALNYNLGYDCYERLINSGAKPDESCIGIANMAGVGSGVIELLRSKA